MRSIRHRPPSPQLATRAPEQDWAGAPCMVPSAAFMWDLDLDNNGRWGLAETNAQRAERHAEAKRMCRDCPALALCQAQSTEGRTGVIAGRLIR